MAESHLSDLTNLPVSSGHGTLRKKSASPYKVARFSPYKLPSKAKSLLNLTGHPHAHPNPPPPAFNLPAASATPQHDTFENQGDTFVATTHVKMPFELWQSGKQIMPTNEQRQQIKALFPTCFGVGVFPPFLVVRCQDLPPKPWPVTVAGLPLWITSDPDERPMDYGVTAQGPKLTITSELALWKTPSEQAFVEIVRAFRKMGAVIDSVQWFGIGFRILSGVEPCNDWKSRLPAFINNLFVGYFIGSEVRSEKAMRKKLPVGRQHDDEWYTDLRPGIIVAGENNLQADNREVMSTAGVCIESPNGTKYITVASHGFPIGVESEVKHPHRNGRTLGRITRIFGESDISLCEIDPGVSYSRETFTTQDAEFPSQPFRDIVDANLLQPGTFVYMDTPYSGRCEGTLMGVEMKTLPHDDPFAEEFEYMFSTFAYFGNGADTLFDGCCGAVLWDQNYDAIAQFRFQSSERDHMCYCPTFKQLRDIGYRLSQV
ncbi:MAG: hypothetical protein Q9218_003383 [Villophora microphyllina]